MLSSFVHRIFDSAFIFHWWLYEVYFCVPTVYLFLTGTNQILYMECKTQVNCSLLELLHWRNNILHTTDSWCVTLDTNKWTESIWYKVIFPVESHCSRAFAVPQGIKIPVIAALQWLHIPSSQRCRALNHKRLSTCAPRGIPWLMEWELESRWQLKSSFD